MRRGFIVGFSLLITLNLGLLIRQAAAQPASDEAAVTVEDAEVTIEPAPSADAAEQVSGEISEGIQKVVPQTGVDSVDSATATLSKAVGDLVENMIEHLPQLAIGLLVLLITIFIAGLAQRISRRAFGRVRLRQSLRDLFSHLIYIAVWFIGILIVLGIVFPGFGMGELIATAGLVSIAIGFAFQDIFENFFAGILILWRFPFEPGDFIEIESENIMGKVEDIWIRMTLIRLTTGELVTVPNSTVYKSPIRILTNRTTRRQSVTCGVAYGEDVTEARKVIRAAMEQCKTVRKDHLIEVILTDFGSSSMDFEIAWWCGAVPLDQRSSRDEVIEAVKKALDAAGIEIPYPYRVLTFTKNEPLIYEKLSGATSDKDGA